MKRVITALIGIPLLIWVIEFAPLSVFYGLIFVVMLLALHEYYALVALPIPFRVAGFLLGSIALLMFMNPKASAIFPAGLILILMVALFARIELAMAFRSVAFAFFGALYVGGLMSFLFALRMMDAESGRRGNLLMMLFCIIWAGDSFAFFAGKTFGRHKLAPVVSPKKTWEGAIAGFIFSILASIICRYTFVQQIGLIDSILIGALVGIFGQIGDLCESIVKRAANVKDSGQILPGHGGMLDRIDSLLFGAPAMYYYLSFFHS
jgi:phosphatidate cytidylyltransferase